MNERKLVAKLISGQEKNLEKINKQLRVLENITERCRREEELEHIWEELRGNTDFKEPVSTEERDAIFENLNDTILNFDIPIPENIEQAIRNKDIKTMDAYIQFKFKKEALPHIDEINILDDDPVDIVTAFNDSSVKLPKNFDVLIPQYVDAFINNKPVFLWLHEQRFGGSSKHDFNKYVHGIIIDLMHKHDMVFVKEYINFFVKVNKLCPLTLILNILNKKYDEPQLFSKISDILDNKTTEERLVCGSINHIINSNCKSIKTYALKIVIIEMSDISFDVLSAIINEHLLTSRLYKKYIDTIFDNCDDSKFVVNVFHSLCYNSDLETIQEFAKSYVPPTPETEIGVRLRKLFLHLASQRNYEVCNWVCDYFRGLKELAIFRDRRLKLSGAGFLIICFVDNDAEKINWFANKFSLPTLLNSNDIREIKRQKKDLSDWVQTLNTEMTKSGNTATCEWITTTFN
jgi:hypothetical protein